MSEADSDRFQKEFDKRYILAAEVSEFVGVSRPAVFSAKNKGRLPGAIVIANGSVLCWEREHIMPILKVWRDYVLLRKKEVQQ